MINLRLRGEFRCTLDVKGRFMLPVALQKQLPVDEREDYRNKLMINRGLDKCLVLYPVSEWDKIEDDLSKLNDFIEEERRFKRLLKSGLSEIDIDKSSRIVIPKMLMEHAGIKKNIVLYADQNKVEVWDEETYNKHIEENGDDLSVLAEKVMGGKSEMIEEKVYHTSVLLKASIEGLNIRPNGVYVDVTYGGGGHSKAILNNLQGGHLIAFDQDSDAEVNLVNSERFTFVNNNFKYLKNFLKYHKFNSVDGILADLGISSYQIDNVKRGFTIRDDSALLDMRMDKTQSLTAEYILNNYDETIIYRILKNYGELKEAKMIANRICNYRKTGTIKTVLDIKNSMGNFHKVNDAKFLAKIFQALRIEVNNELESLQEFLLQAKEMLKPSGRLVVISYHSLEDRLVKNFMRYGAFEESTENFSLYTNNTSCFKAITKKAIQPDDNEIFANNRSRSAKLRICEKL